ncbi:uncharacterized protein LOC122060967 [Macadamia integrifolia]|uniref:uncharacterized protein LOC122060967 n=1 Tax=Macadamia integrifolia TaxID=60698 RepID=UPI001C527B24|nr:uncharacterized protein LOC122060967 [Macadamia integrifolia]
MDPFYCIGQRTKSRSAFRKSSVSSRGNYKKDQTESSGQCSSRPVAEKRTRSHAAVINSHRKPSSFANGDEEVNETDVKTARGKNDDSWQSSSDFSDKNDDSEDEVVDQVFTSLINFIWEKGEAKVVLESISSKHDSHKEEIYPPMIETKFPLKFSFGIKKPIIVEKSESEKELDQLWEEFDSSLDSSEIGSFGSSLVSLA